METEVLVEVSDSSIVVKEPEMPDKRIRWKDLVSVEIETNSLGPYVPDVLWVLRSAETRVVIPQGAEGEEELLTRLQVLPGFDNEAFIESMGSTSDATFPIWQKE